MKERLKSPVLRIVLAMLLVYFAKRYYSFDLPDEKANLIIEAIFLLIFGVGAYNNPTDRTKF